VNFNRIFRSVPPNPGSIQFQVYDITNSVYIGTASWYSFPNATVSIGGPMGLSVATIIVSAQTDIDVRLFRAGNISVTNSIIFNNGTSDSDASLIISELS
jgi:hypothetical protein